MSAPRFEQLRREVALFAPLARVVPSDLLIVLEPLQSALQLAYRQGHIHVQELAAVLEIEAEEARTLGAQLLEKGYLQPAPPEETDEYHARFSGRITRPGGSPLDRI
jgi:hypothetical protein